MDLDLRDQLLLCICQVLDKKKNEKKRAVQQLFMDFKKAYHAVRREIFYNVFIVFGVT